MGFRVYSSLESGFEALEPPNKDFSLYQYVLTAIPIATKKPIIADIIALPEPGSMYANDGCTHKERKSVSKKNVILFILIFILKIISFFIATSKNSL